MVGADPAGYLVALAAGAVSFLSPCFLPLVPGYIAFISGGGATERPRRVLLFVAGFATVFTALGLGSALAGGAIIRQRELLELVGGVFIALLGLMMLSPRLPSLLAREHKFTLVAPTGNVATVGVGMVFAIGWSPCIGPTLGAVLALATTSGSAVSGASLLLVFSAGLGVPLMLMALSMDRFGKLARRLSPHSRRIQIFSAMVLIVFGVLLATGTIGNISAKLSTSAPINI
ncbi:MAG: cytochrome c biogenesis protein CcdA [Solirubrobacterales bacterium]